MPFFCLPIYFQRTKFYSKLHIQLHSKYYTASEGVQQALATSTSTYWNKIQKFRLTKAKEQCHLEGSSSSLGMDPQTCKCFLFFFFQKFPDMKRQQASLEIATNFLCTVSTTKQVLASKATFRWHTNTGAPLLYTRRAASGKLLALITKSNSKHRTIYPISTYATAKLSSVLAITSTPILAVYLLSVYTSHKHLIFADVITAPPKYFTVDRTQKVLFKLFPTTPASQLLLTSTLHCVLPQQRGLVSHGCATKDTNQRGWHASWLPHAMLLGPGRPDTYGSSLVLLQDALATSGERWPTLCLLQVLDTLEHTAQRTLDV